ncbi:G-alpha-domain-containing protein [Amylocystis lapponica]|nr:G-alpha-domain-containing protein [Amylocystis lapponica]
MLRQGEKAKNRKRTVKVLLLGQSESGKSTTLKQFQLLHTPEAFQAERLAWRFVIYLNLVRSIRRILDAIASDPDATNGLDDIDDYDSMETASIIITANGRPASSLAGAAVPGFEGYLKRLTPLLELEVRLIQQLSDHEEDNDEQEATHLPSLTPASSSGGAPGGGDEGRALPRITIPNGARARSPPTSPESPGMELAVSTTSNWKKAFALGKIQSPKSAHSGELVGWWEDPDDPVHVLNRCAPVMSELWRDPCVRQRLAERRLRLEESSGFYLDEIDRITAKMYFPTDEDVLKARLKTTGVVEHTFSLAKNSEFRGVNWKIYDVGGARNQRQAWAPYFDDAVVSNKLLCNVNIILFLNKCDLLKAKLESGVRLTHHMTSYGDRPNDYNSVSRYFHNKFGAVHQSFTPNKARELFIHLTSVIDTRRTHTIITNVRDIILTTNLRSSSLM